MGWLTKSTNSQDRRSAHLLARLAEIPVDASLLHLRLPNTESDAQVYSRAYALLWNVLWALDCTEHGLRLLPVIFLLQPRIPYLGDGYGAER